MSGLCDRSFTNFANIAYLSFSGKLLSGTKNVIAYYKEMFNKNKILVQVDREGAKFYVST